MAAPVQDTAGVEVTLKVEPVASVSLPQGSNFLLRVEPLSCPPMPIFVPRPLRRLWHLVCWTYLVDSWPPVRPVRIPFSIEGNAHVTAAVRPSAFLRIAGNHYLGRAARTGGATLGYHIVTHFPAPSRQYQWVADWMGWDNWALWRTWAGYGLLPVWSHVAQLPGQDGVGTSALPANLPGLGNEAFGVIYVVARRGWTTNGSDAAPGDYLGSIVITITSE